MTPEFAYFLKVNVAFVLLYAFYRLFFYKDTFFKLRRAILLAFFGLSLFYPLMNIQDWMKEQEPMVEVIQIYSSMLPEIVITPENIPETDWHGIFISGISYCYWGGVILLFLRFLLQLGSILMLARKSGRTAMHGVPVRLLAKPAGPFSFFRLIFLHPDSHSEKEIDEILTHECTHVSQWHSVDVLICELVNIICWVNPFAWLLKREVRHNLEYLADNRVLESGYDCKSYQYHLLGLAHHDKSTAVLYNSFNMLHLKNRISMMNKKRSRGISRTKYLAFIPVSAGLMLLSNIDAVARITDKLTDELAGGLTKHVRMDISGDMAVQIYGFGMEPQSFKLSNLNDNMDVQVFPGKEKVDFGETSKSDLFFTVVEKMPEFPGGTSALSTYLSENTKYSVIAQENKIHGRVSCSFVVKKDGSITNVEVVRSVDPSLDKEAARVVSSMPSWKPGSHRGETVNVRYTIPVIFRLKAKNEAFEDGKSQKSSIIKRIDTSGQMFTIVEKKPEYTLPINFRL